ncbi:MAG: DNA internalization-related competence protein ComEC/Rec2 [Gammaproteobacteria bacterium]|nr:MAG: DNA internalization-related competence protein ComEC/Rec2 [Gammaproteobacteria bacterium]
MAHGYILIYTSSIHNCVAYFHTIYFKRIPTMFLFIITFFIGDLYLQTFAQLPPPLPIYSLLAISGFAYFLLRKHYRYSYLPFAFLLGLTYSFWYAGSLLSWELPKSQEGKPILVTGYVASLPIIDSWQTNFLFQLEPSNVLIKLALRDNDQPIKVGEKRQFLVRLKRIHSTQNPGGFDYEAWSLQKGLRATGYVVPSTHNIVFSHAWYHHPVDQLRQRLQEKIKLYLPQSKTSPWLTALIIGERDGVAQEDWQVLRNTGTNHLMAIAGLHIGIMAGLAHFIVSWLWRRNAYLALRLPAQQAGAGAALIIAMVYSMLAGFSIPTQRACIMLTVFILALLSRRPISAWYSWALAIAVVLILNPLSVLTDSFWLSFGTLALIIYGMSARLAPSGWWWKWGRVQWVIGFGLIPLSLSLFQECSLISFLANSIAIPWLEFLILPFCFLSGIFLFIFPPIGKWLLIIADKSLSGLWLVLTWFAHLHFSSWQQAMPSMSVMMLTIIGILFLLSPAGFPGRWFGVVWMMPLLFYQPNRPANGDFWLTLLDVGQGLSVVVQTKTHLLVYDTGLRLNENFDMGESVVLPYLHTLGTKRIDMMVISHGDNDHSGGAKALLAALPVTSLKTSAPEKFPLSITSHCLAGQSWQWDHVNFTFLYPDTAHLDLDNDSSCVLRIDNGQQSVLLTGDIEKSAETILLDQASHQLAATLLVAPHHGSKTSGLPEFIAATHPQFVLYAIGYRNRYHFPNPAVIEAYQAIHAIQLNTVETGAIQFQITKNHPLQPIPYRLLHPHYWAG